jgi:acetyl-CoA carboxylase beta subunit
MGAATLAVALVLIVFRRCAVATQKTYRCNTCKQCWPDDSRFAKCPECKTACWHKTIEGADIVPTLKEALRAKAYIDFDEYYDEKVAREMQASLTRIETGGISVSDFVS